MPTSICSFCSKYKRISEILFITNLKMSLVRGEYGIVSRSDGRRKFIQTLYVYKLNLDIVNPFVPVRSVGFARRLVSKPAPNNNGRICWEGF